MSSDDTIIIFQEGKNKFHVKRVMAAEDLFGDSEAKMEKLNIIFNKKIKLKYCRNYFQAINIAEKMNKTSPAEYGIIKKFILPPNFKI